MSVPQSQPLPVRPRDSTPEEGGEVGEKEAKEGYCHDIAVAAITSLLAHAAELYDKVELEKLQENGIYTNGLTDRVLELMRHIPYFTQNLPDLMVDTHPAHHLGNFTSCFTESPVSDEEKEAARKRIVEASEDLDQAVPPHMLVFTTVRRHRCYSILIDTKRGAVHFWDREASGFPTEQPGDLDGDPDLDDDEVEADGARKSWKLAPVYRIQTFFDLWKRELFMVKSNFIKFMRQEQSAISRNANLVQ
ncbi:hypothetical protein PG994_002471 [Apiospora phragmitis]|uniref:Ubiquitinyl hydrolase 1 n=1 Tax=Apiospora phragmitis TaxID=2905665 RepID=A0ABR1WWM8_9PEZI